MKIKQSLITTLLAAAGLAFVNSASAQTDVYISGATTFRGPVMETILDQGTTGVLVSGSTNVAYVGSSAFGAAEAIVHGYLKSSPTSEVYIHLFWTGSAAGVYDCGHPNNISGWIAEPAGSFSASATFGTTGVAWSNTVTGSNPAVITGGQINSDPGSNLYPLATAHYPDAILSDSLNTTVANELNTAPPAGTVGTGLSGLQACGNSTRNTSSAAAANGTVGVAPILWVLGNTGSNPTPNIYNMTQQGAASLIQGPTSAELLSGSHADKTNWLCLIGRNEDSGTRIAAFSEPQYGVVTTAVKQYLPTFVGTSGTQAPSPNYPSAGNPSIPEGGSGATIQNLGLWPTDWTLNTANTIDWIKAGHSGFTGGGDVAACLSAVNPVTGLTFIKSGTFGDYPNDPVDADPNVAGGPTGFVSTESVWLIGYIGVADAVGSGSITLSTTNPSGALTASGVKVTNGRVLGYNGVQYSGIGAVENGSYTFWVLEHMYYNPSNADTNSNTNIPKIAVDDIADALYVTYACTNSSGQTDPSGTTHPNVAGVLYGSMDFTRSKEGAVPSTK